MIIRKIEEKDADEVFSLIQAKAEFDGDIDSLKSNKAKLKEAFFAPMPKASAIIAEVEGKVIGMATYYSIYSTFIAKSGIWLDDLFVYEAYRKTGAGKKLMSKLCDIAVESNCGRIDWLVAVDNENGRGFYESIGAQIFEVVRHSRLDEEAIHKLSNK